MMKHLIFIFVLYFFCNAVVAQHVTIRGNAKSYAGDVLSISCYDDLITFKEKTLAQCKVSENGDFLFKFKLEETLKSFIHLNVFKGILFVEPGKQYEIVLPQKVSKLPEDELNPFFEEAEYFLRILNTNEKELNSLIKNFDNLFDAYNHKYFNQFKGKLNKSIADSIIGAIDKSIGQTNNAFFNDYKAYNYLMLRFMAYERDKEKHIREAFIGKPVLYQNPAYMEFFNQLFSSYLESFAKTEKGKMIPYHLVKEKSLKNIKKVLSLDSLIIDDQLQDLIIAKSLFENYYKDDFPREDIVFMMDSIKTAAKSAQNKQIAGNIYEKLTTLMLSYPAPDFELPDESGKLKSLARLNGKFVYLGFINPKSYTCQQELEVLKKMAVRKYEMLEIVTVCVCENLNEMQKLVKDKGYTWTFLFYSKNQQLLKNYNVKVYPTYFMINPEGKLIMLPAFPPTEPSFEARYFDVLKSWKLELERKKAKGLQK